MLKTRLLSLLLLAALEGQLLLGWVAPTAAAAPPVATEQALEQTPLPWRDLRELAVRVKGLSLEQVDPPAPPAAPERRVGDTSSFWVADEANDRYYQVRATLMVVTAHAYMYVADGVRVDQGKLEEAARFFEDRIYPTDRRYFGNERETGLDGDPHVTILHARIPGLGGYFTSVDDYPRSVQIYSNERKAIYINIEAAPPGSASYYGILAHELEHMIQWNTNRMEQTWVKEGAAEVATEAANLGGSSSMQSFLSRPDTQLNAWIDSKGDVAPHYGAAYMFISYFLEHYGGYEAAAELLSGDTRGPETFDRFLARRGYNLTFEDVFKDWVVANYLDGAGATDPRYRYAKLNVQVPDTDRVTTSADWRDRTVHQFAADYIALSGRWSQARIQFEGDRETRVIPAPAHSGNAFWWSNRGDLVDSWMTHVFDLRAVSRATLGFWTWYDLEEGYDYGYVMISRDGGLTWTTLATPDTTTDDPNGNNLGSGFTGRSGGWRWESVDLTPYAGDVVVIRFEHVTDDAYNAPGFAVDDITIPEVGYSADAEDSDGGWSGNGFVRTDGRLTEPFSLQLIRMGRDGVAVEPVPVSSTGSAEIEVRNPDGRLDKAVLVVSALSRYTTEPAHYRYRVEMSP